MLLSLLILFFIAKLYTYRVALPEKERKKRMLSGDRRVHIRFVVVCSRSESISQSHIVGGSFYSHSLLLCCLSLALQVIIFLYGFNTWASITRNTQLTHHRPSIQVFCRRRHNRIMFYCSNTSSRKVKCYTRHYCSYMVFGLSCHHDGAMHTVHTYSTETFFCPTIRWHWLPSSWFSVWMTRLLFLVHQLQLRHFSATTK